MWMTVCTVKENPLDYLEYANSLHKNLQFTLETPNYSGDLAFLDLNINVGKEQKISCQWYQKLTDTSIISNLRSCARLHQKNVIQGTVHRIATECNATSDWQYFDVALKKNQDIWTENQYPFEWPSSFVNETLDKIVTKEKVTKPPNTEQYLKEINSLHKKELKPMFFVQNRGNITQSFASRLRNSVIFKSLSQRENLELACPT